MMLRRSIDSPMVIGPGLKSIARVALNSDKLLSVTIDYAIRDGNLVMDVKSIANGVSRPSLITVLCCSE